MVERSRGTQEFDPRHEERELAREVLQDLADLALRDGAEAEKKDDVFTLLRRCETLRELGRTFALSGVDGAYRESVVHTKRLLDAQQRLNLDTSELVRRQRIDERLLAAPIWTAVTHVPTVDLVEAHRMGVFDASGVAKHADTLLRGRLAIAEEMQIDSALTPWNWNPEGDVMMSRGGRTLHGKGFAAFVRYTPEQSREAEKLIALRNELHTGRGDEEEVLRRKVAFEEDLVRYLLHAVARAVHTRDLARA